MRTCGVGVLRNLPRGTERTPAEVKELVDTEALRAREVSRTRIVMDDLKRTYPKTWYSVAHALLIIGHPIQLAAFSHISSVGELLQYYTKSKSSPKTSVKSQSGSMCEPQPKEPSPEAESEPELETQHQPIKHEPQPIVHEPQTEHQLIEPEPAETQDQPIDHEPVTEHQFIEHEPEMEPIEHESEESLHDDKTSTSSGASSVIPFISALQAKKDTKKHLEKHNVLVRLEAGTKLRKKNQYLRVFAAHMKSECISECNVRNTITNSMRIMKFFTPCHNPQKFKPVYLTSFEKLIDFANVLNDSGMKAETIRAHFSHFTRFCKFLSNTDAIRKDDKALATELLHISQSSDSLRAKFRRQVNRERAALRAETMYRPDTSEADLRDMHQTVAKLEVVVRPMIAKCRNSPDEKPRQGVISTVNGFFMTLFSSQGARADVFKNMSIAQYFRAKSSEPCQHAEYGLSVCLGSGVHKTSHSYLAMVYFTPVQFRMLNDYVDYVRPQPAFRTDEPFLFLSTVGRRIKDAVRCMQKAYNLVGGSYKCPTRQRHAIETYTHTKLDASAQKKVSRLLCHGESTAKKHYVDTQNLDEGWATVAGLKACVLPSEALVSQDSDQDDDDINDANVCSETTLLSARQERLNLLQRHFDPITAGGEVPTKQAYLEVIEHHGQEYAHLDASSLSVDEFTSVCLEKRNNLRAEAIVTAIGERYVTDSKAEVTAELKKMGWYSDETLEMAVILYKKNRADRFEADRMPQRLATATQTAQTVDSSSSESGPVL